jgi:hypothetical protein
MATITIMFTKARVRTMSEELDFKLCANVELGCCYRSFARPSLHRSFSTRPGLCAPRRSH